MGLINAWNNFIQAGEIGVLEMDAIPMMSITHFIPLKNMFYLLLARFLGQVEIGSDISSGNSMLVVIYQWISFNNDLAYFKFLMVFNSHAFCSQRFFSFLKYVCSSLISLFLNKKMDDFFLILKKFFP